MKSSFAVLVALAAFNAPSAQAEGVNPAEYAWVNAYHGADSPTGKPAPTASSIIQAKAVYDAFVTPAIMGTTTKFVGLYAGVQNVGVYARPFRADYGFVLKKSELAVPAGSDASIEIRGTAAQALFEALPAPATPPATPGASTRSAGNLSCDSTGAADPAVAPSFSCSLANVDYYSMGLDELMALSPSNFTAAMAEELILLSGY